MFISVLSSPSRSSSQCQLFSIEPNQLHFSTISAPFPLHCLHTYTISAQDTYHATTDLPHSFMSRSYDNRRLPHAPVSLTTINPYPHPDSLPFPQPQPLLLQSLLLYLLRHRVSNRITRVCTHQSLSEHSESQALLLLQFPTSSSSKFSFLQHPPSTWSTQ